MKLFVIICIECKQEVLARHPEHKWCRGCVRKLNDKGAQDPMLAAYGAVYFYLIELDAIDYEELNRKYKGMCDEPCEYDCRGLQPEAEINFLEESRWSTNSH